MLLDITSAAPITSALINLFKLAWPTAPMWAIVAVSLVAGIGGAFVVTLAQGQAITTQLAAQDTLIGITVAVAASGLDRLSSTAQARRDRAQNGALQTT